MADVRSTKKNPVKIRSIRKTRNKSKTRKANPPPKIRTLQDILAEKNLSVKSNTYHRELGHYLNRRKRYFQAVKAFDEAITRNPTDVRTLSGRCKARLKRRNFKEALESANTLVKEHPNNLTAYSHKTLVNYISTEFENSFIECVRKTRIEDSSDLFYCRARDCMTCIKNAIGKRAGHPLRDQFQIIREMEFKKNLTRKKSYTPRKKSYRTKLNSVNCDEQTKPVKPIYVVCAERYSSGDPNTKLLNTLHEEFKERPFRLDIPEIQYNFKPIQPYSTNIKNYLANTYLGELYKDKIFLENLSKHEGFPGFDKNSVCRMLKLSKYAVQQVNKNENILRARRPFYFMKLQKSKIDKSLKKSMESKSLQHPLDNSEKASKLLEEFKILVREKECKEALQQGLKLEHFCKSIPVKFLPNKNRYLKQIYRLFGNIFVDMKCLSSEFSDFDPKRRVRVILGLESNSFRSNDSILNLLGGDFLVDYKKEINLLSENVRVSRCCQEVIWLYHELSRYYLEIKNYMLAKSYAKSCMRLAKLYNDTNWEINAYVLVIRVLIETRRKKQAESCLIDAVKIAEEKRNPELCRFLQVGLELLEESNLSEFFYLKKVEKRQEEIVRAVTEEGVKNEAEHMFRIMCGLPGHRRLSVLPGCNLEELKVAAEKVKYQSIMPKGKSVEDKVALKKKTKPKGLKDLLGDYTFHIVN